MTLLQFFPGQGTVLALQLEEVFSVSSLFIDPPGRLLLFTKEFAPLRMRDDLGLPTGSFRLIAQPTSSIGDVLEHARGGI